MTGVHFGVLQVQPFCTDRGDLAKHVHAHHGCREAHRPVLVLLTPDPQALIPGQLQKMLIFFDMVEVQHESGSGPVGKEEGEVVRILRFESNLG